MSTPIVSFLADTSTERAVAVSASNPLPVAATLAVGGTIGVEGIDGSTQASASNPLPVGTTPASVAGVAIVPVVSTALETGHVIKNSAGNLYGFNGAATTVAGFFLVHNTTAVPAAGSVTPIRAYPVAIGQAIEVSFDPPIRCGTGISISFTSATTPFTQTDSATAFISGSAV